VKRCSKYGAGQLREVATFERLVRVSNGRGGFSEIWAAYATARAMVRPLSGRETLMQDRVNATASHMLVCRYFSIPAPRIVNGGTPASVMDGDVFDGGAPGDTMAPALDGGPAYDVPRGEPVEADRVTVRGKVYNIRHIRNLDMLDEWFEITMESGVAD
jgi:hypothetical protein